MLPKTIQYPQRSALFKLKKDVYLVFHELSTEKSRENFHVMVFETAFSEYLKLVQYYTIYCLYAGQGCPQCPSQGLMIHRKEMTHPSILGGEKFRKYIDFIISVTINFFLTDRI